MEDTKSDIKKLIREEGFIRKFDGCAPEGFVLVHEKTLEDLKNFYIWQDWKNNELTIKQLNIENLKKYP